MEDYMFKKIVLTAALSTMLISCASDAKKDDGDYMVETRNDTVTNANPVETARDEEDLTYKEIKNELDESNVYFAFDSSKIKMTEKEKLKTVAKTLEAVPSNATVVVKGYTDATGPEEYNKDLSRRRAEAARAALIEYGVPATKLRTQALGESMANSNIDNQTEQSWGYKDEGRKVSFDIIKDDRDGKSQDSSTSSEIY